MIFDLSGLREWLAERRVAAWQLAVNLLKRLIRRCRDWIVGQRNLL